MRAVLVVCLVACARPAPPDCLTLVAPVGPVGFDRAFTVEARVTCPGDGSLSWRSGGEGSVWKGRTPSIVEARGELPWGIVPFAPANRGEVVVEAVWRGGGVEVRRQVTVAAAARATGVPSLPAGTTYVLGGDGWRATAGPKGFEGTVAVAAGVTTFTPHRAGRFELTDGAGRQLALRVNRHDETPLDCGRADCHPQATETARSSPMTTVFHRGLEGKLAPDYDPGCAVACHTVGEPGTSDGGFVDVAAGLSFTLPAHGAPGTWDHLPRALRRLGGVGCTTCHGPAAIPEEGARWSILRADVCAVCHDAPPRYPKVAAWRASKMARADATPGTRAEGCRDCHTTWGFLSASGARQHLSQPPDDVAPMGIACAACHAPHAAALRQPPAPASLGALPPSASSVCLPCHAGSAAALWLGRGGQRADGTALEGPAPHAKVACTGCHDAAAHTFAPRCTGCHETAPPRDPSLAARAAALAARLGVTHHATPGATGPAAHNVALVAEDPAAWVHNPAYARQLLDEAERLAPRAP